MESAVSQQAFVFGDEIGGRISSVKTAWSTACREAGVVGLRFHDLRREFACRLLESSAELHDVRDFLGHSNITTTSRYLRSTTLRRERALKFLERAERARSDEARAHSKKNSRKFATPLPHERFQRSERDPDTDPEVVDAIEDVMVSPEGIEPSTNRLRVCCSAS